MSPVLIFHENGSISPASQQHSIGRYTWENPLQSDGEIELALLAQHSGPKGPENDPQLLILRSGRLEYPHHTWGAHGHAAFDVHCQSLQAQNKSRSDSALQILFRPHHADVLSDIQRCLAFVRDEARRRSDGFGLVFDPVGLLAPSMISQAADHLARWSEVVADTPGFEILLVRRPDREGTPETENSKRTSPFADEPIDLDDPEVELLRPVAESWARSRRPILIPATNRSTQIAILGSWGLSLEQEST